jgi:beta-mannosidase
VWSTDEGLRGIAVHVANDTAETVCARLRVSLYSDFEVPVEEVTRELELAPHSGGAHDIEELLGRFVDVSWAYRFGPVAQDVVVCSLERDGDAGVELLSQCFRLPGGRVSSRDTASRLGLRATLRRRGERAELTVGAQRFVYGVRVRLPGFQAADDAFSIEPGGERHIALKALSGEHRGGEGVITALNLAGRVPIIVSED